MPKPILLAEILLGWGGVFLRLQMSPYSTLAAEKGCENERRDETGGGKYGEHLTNLPWAMLVYSLEHQPWELFLGEKNVGAQKNQGDTAYRAPFLESHKVQGSKTNKQTKSCLILFHPEFPKRFNSEALFVKTPNIRVYPLLHRMVCSGLGQPH